MPGGPEPMRYVIYGAGAVGGTIGGRLYEHGHEVVLIARGAHLETMRSHGLRLRRPDGEETWTVPVAGSPSDAGVGHGDVVILSTKTQDTRAALAALAPVAPPDLPIVCAQNGVENERLALRCFRRVYAMRVLLPASVPEPGVVQANGTPVSGVLNLGRYPKGLDPIAERIATDLDASGFSSSVEPAIMRLKYRKLVMNLESGLKAVLGQDDRTEDLRRRLHEEAEAVFAVARIDVASVEEESQRRASLQTAPIAGRGRGGSSVWQSLSRQTGSIETDYLNGEIVLLGRLHNVPTPVNAVVQQLAARLARERQPPGSVTLAEFEARLA